MDRVSCDVVRDLMPLMLDDVASDDSKKIVEEHIETCETCKAYYEGMALHISRGADSDAAASFAGFLNRMKRRNMMRRVLIIVLAVVLIAAIVLMGKLLILDRMHTYSRMPLEAATAQIYIDVGESILLDVMACGDYGLYTYDWTISDCGNDEVIVYVMPMEPELKLWRKGEAHHRDEIEYFIWKDFLWENDQLYFEEDYGNEDYGMTLQKKLKVLSLRWGAPGEYAEIYGEGDILPAAPNQ